MPIVIRLDVIMARRKVRSRALARAIGISETNLSLLKSGKVRGVRFATLDAICRYLDCTPADILEFEPDEGVADGGDHLDLSSRLSTKRWGSA